jgi:hypothetical protein
MAASDRQSEKAPPTTMRSGRIASTNLVFPYRTTYSRDCDRRALTMTFADWQSTSSAITGAISAVGVIAAVIGAGLALRAARRERRDRRDRHTRDIRHQWEELADIRMRVIDHPPAELRVVIEKAWTEKSTEFFEMLREPLFFEDLAERERSGVVDFDVIYSALGVLVSDRWDNWCEAVFFLRSKAGYQFYGFQALAERVDQLATKA